MANVEQTVSVKRLFTRPTLADRKQEHTYRKQIARQLRTQYVEGTHRLKYYIVTLKCGLEVTQGH